MYRKDGHTDYIYENPEVVQGQSGNKITDSTQGTSSKLTGSDFVRIRRSGAAAVCVVLLVCVLLLIVLCVRFTEERQRLMSTIGNLTDERDQLIFKNKNLTDERDQLNEILIHEGWIYYQYSIYYMSKETMNWAESRRRCRERGADLIIINNREEQDFIESTFGGASVYIGLTDIAVEGRWEWVDGTNMTSGFWGSEEPDGGTGENCIMTVNHDPTRPNLFGWRDVECNRDFQWICEKRISQIILS